MATTDNSASLVDSSVGSAGDLTGGQQQQVVGGQSNVPLKRDRGLDDEDDDDDDRKPGRERRKIEIKFIQDKSRRHITFSKRKAGIMKKAYELSVLTGTQVLLLVVSETGLVYTFTTPKLQPLVTKPEGKNLIQACLNAPEESGASQPNGHDNGGGLPDHGAGGPPSQGLVDDPHQHPQHLAPHQQLPPPQHPGQPGHPQHLSQSQPIPGQQGLGPRGGSGGGPGGQVPGQPGIPSGMYMSPEQAAVAYHQYLGGIPQQPRYMTQQQQHPHLQQAQHPSQAHQ